MNKTKKDPAFFHCILKTLGDDVKPHKQDQFRECAQPQGNLRDVRGEKVKR